MENNNFTPEESLAIISKAISNFKTNYKESSKVFLLWGWVLTLASFSNFIILRILQSSQSYNLMGPLSLANWMFFSLIAFIILFFMTRKLNRSKKTFNHLDNYIKRLWIAAAMGFFVGIFICAKLEINPPAIMLLIAGIATTASGLLIKFKPLIIGGISFFIFSIATSFVTNEYTALIVGVSIIFGYLVPGYFLKFAKE